MLIWKMSVKESSSPLWRGYFPAGQACMHWQPGHIFVVILWRIHQKPQPNRQIKIKWKKEIRRSRKQLIYMYILYTRHFPHWKKQALLISHFDATHNQSVWVNTLIDIYIMCGRYWMCLFPPQAERYIKATCITTAKPLWFPTVTQINLRVVQTEG